MMDRAFQKGCTCKRTNNEEFPRTRVGRTTGEVRLSVQDLIGANFMRAGCESHDVYALDSWNDVM